LEQPASELVPYLQENVKKKSEPAPTNIKWRANTFRAKQRLVLHLSVTHVFYSPLISPIKGRRKFKTK
jgi:hypothetical protein